MTNDIDSDGEDSKRAHEQKLTANRIGRRSVLSVGCAEQYDPSALSLLFDGFDVVVPQTVVDEIKTLASYEHNHRQAAQAAALLRNVANSS